MASLTSSSRPSKNTIWIGNLDPKVTEFQLLKIVEPFGRVVRFDFMYTNNETGDRQPRGYAFVTYEDHVTAAEAIAKLNGTKLLSRELRVQQSSATHIPSKSSSHAAAAKLPLSISLSLDKKEDSGKKVSAAKDKLSKIRAMEAKLKALNKEEDFKLQVPTSSSKSSLHNSKPYDRPKK